MLKKHTLVVGPFQCNCQILVCQKTNEAIIIDAGDEYDRIKKLCTEHGIHLKYSVHTHAHLDHIGAVKELKSDHPHAKIALHSADEKLYQNLPMQGQMFGIDYETPPPIDHFLRDEEVIRFGEHEFKVIHTPGHSPGGVCLHFKEGELSEMPTVFTGDTLFQQSIGRTDLWGGDHRQLIKSIKDRLLRLDDQTVVPPGHGPVTSIGVETKSNPFL